MRKSQADEEVPRTLGLLWKRARGQPHGADVSLNLDRIVAAAVELADARGLPALSMARLAQSLGCATMSLYRHVANKEELQALMVDAASGPPPGLAGAADWRIGLERWARELRAVYYRHPWILQMTTGRPPLEPGQLAWLEAGLRAFDGTRLAPREKMSAILLTLNYVRGEAQIATGLLQAHKRTRQEESDMQAWYGRMLARLVDAERFPALTELIAAGAFGADPGGGSEEFDFGLARLLDGLEAWLRTR
jgi:AcrR family transcriptional regulator